MSEETSVMFEIGVMEHPATKSRIDALTKLVVDSQAKMTVGMDRVGLMAQSAGSAIAPLVAQMASFKKSALAGYSEMQQAANGLNSEKVVNIVINGSEKLAELDSQLARMQKSGVGIGGTGTSVSNGSPNGSTGSAKDPMADMAPSLRNVFKELEADAKGSADAIFQAFDEAKANLPTSIKANTQLIKEEYKKRVQDQKKSMEEMQDSLRQAVDGQSEATERMNMNLVKGGRSLIGMTKGFAELGLMSAESTEQLAKGMVVIQGAFDIFDGLADMLEVVSGGHKAMRLSMEASNKVAEIQKAMAGPQFAQLKAYQAQLAQETIAANAATAANSRLNMSRGATGVIAGGAVKAASGAATSAVAGAAGAAAGAGVVAPGAATTVGVALAPFAAAAAALASLGVVAYQLSETFSGTATKVGSFTDTIASGEVSLGTWLVRLGRSDKDVMASKSTLGFADLAKSQITTELMEKKSAKSRILADHNENVTNLKTAANDETIQVNFKEDARATRSRTENTGSLDAKIAGELKIQTEAMMAMAASQRIVDKARDGEIVDKKTAAKAGTDVGFFQNQIAQSQARQTADQSGFAGTKLSDEKGIGDKAAKSYNDDLEVMVGLIKDGNTASKDYEAAVARTKASQASAIDSLEKQKSIIKEKLSIEIQGQQKIQDLLKSHLDLKTQALQKSQDEQASAISNFSKLGQIEKQQAIDALAKGRKQGGGSLDDVEKDLLRSVGTKEAVRLANEGDADEAKKFGFNDKNFDAGFDTEQAGLKAAKTQIEAKLSTSYDVNVKLINDTSGIVDGVVNQVSRLFDNERKQLGQAIDEGVKSKIAASVQQSNLQLRALRR